MELTDKKMTKLIYEEIDKEDPFFEEYNIEDVIKWIKENIEEIARDPKDPEEEEIWDIVSKIRDWYYLTDNELYFNYNRNSNYPCIFWDMIDYVDNFIFSGNITQKQIDRLHECGLKLGGYVLQHDSGDITVFGDEMERDVYISDEVNFYEWNKLNELDVVLLELLTDN